MKIALNRLKLNHQLFPHSNYPVVIKLLKLDFISMAIREFASDERYTEEKHREGNAREKILNFPSKCRSFIESVWNIDNSVQTSILFHFHFQENCATSFRFLFFLPLSLSLSLFFQIRRVLRFPGVG